MSMSGKRMDSSYPGGWIGWKIRIGMNERDGGQGKAAWRLFFVSNRKV